MKPNYYTKTFNPTKYFFNWTDDWYTWDSERAKTMAIRKRDHEVKLLKKNGYEVRKFAKPDQIFTRGGAGGNPPIRLVTTLYGYEYKAKEPTI